MFLRFYSDFNTSLGWTFLIIRNGVIIEIEMYISIIVIQDIICHDPSVTVVSAQNVSFPICNTIMEIINETIPIIIELLILNLMHFFHVEPHKYIIPNFFKLRFELIALAIIAVKIVKIITQIIIGKIV